MAARTDEGSLEGVGGLEIRWRAWLPEEGMCAIVLLSHGASEHGGRYAWVGEQLAAAGYALYAPDHRGHGRSEGPRALIGRVDNAVADLHTAMALASARHSGTPTFLLGHSMGGCIALEYALRYQDELDGLVLSAPVAVLEAASPVTRAIGNLLSLIAPRAPVFAIDPGLVSRDPGVVRDYEQDPLNYHGRLPARTVAELSRSVDSFPDRVPTLRLPLLVMHGTGDDLVPIAGSEMVADRAGSEDKTFTRYDGLYHEILNEPERDRVMDEIVGWLDVRSRGLSPAAPRAESSSGPEAPTGSMQ